MSCKQSVSGEREGDEHEGAANLADKVEDFERDIQDVELDERSYENDD